MLEPLIDDAFNAYLEWRDESAEVWHSYKRWKGARNTPHASTDRS